MAPSRSGWERGGDAVACAAASVTAAVTSIAVVAVICAFALFVSASGPGPAEWWRFVVTDGETGEELWSASVRAGDVIVYAYTHSADKTPIESWLRVEAPTTGFVLEHERYLWYGAGLEFRADFGVVLEDGWVVVYAERPLPRLPLRVAGTVEQRLIVGEDWVMLGDLAPFGRRIMLEVKP